MVTIRRCVSADAEAVIKMQKRAFQTPMSEWFEWTRPVIELDFINDSFATIVNPNAQNYVACDEENHIIGYGSFYEKGRDANQSSSWLGRIESYLYGWQLYMSNIVTYVQNRADLKENRRRLALLSNTKEENWKRLKKSEGFEGFVYYAVLAVDPRAKRRGIGAKLLQLGLDQAQKANIPLQLESTKEGYPFYMSQGLKPAGNSLDLRDGDRLVESFENVIWYPSHA